MRHTVFAATALVASLLPAAANATVRYDFTAFSSSNLVGEQITGGGFSLQLSNYLTSDTTFPLASLTSCSVSTTAQPVASCGSQDLYISSVYNYIGFQINTTLNPSTYVYYYFNVGTFGTPGTYSTVLPGLSQSGQLVVTDLSRAVPEPATWAMMFAGFAAIGAAMRKRRTVVSFG